MAATLRTARTVAGRRFWLYPLIPLVWPLIQFLWVYMQWRETDFDIPDAQNFLIGLPLAVLASLLGIRIIAGEIDRRTLEIAFTVPGGAHRIWLAKITAAIGMIVLAEALLALATWLLLTDYPLSALYGAFQASIFMMIMGMGLAALFKSESAGGMLTVGVFFFAYILQRTRVSPFYNPEMLDLDAAQRIAGLVQNRIGFLIAIVTVLLLTFGRAEQRERMLGG